MTSWRSGSLHCTPGIPDIPGGEAIRWRSQVTLLLYPVSWWLRWLQESREEALVETLFVI